MCNYSYGVKESGRLEGRLEGFDEGRVASFYDLVKDGYPQEKAKQLLHVTDEMLRKYRNNRETTDSQ